MGKELNISTGVEEYSLNGKVKIYFNPTDADFTERIYRSFDFLDAKQDEYQKRIDASESVEQSLAFLKELDTEMREHLFSIFGEDIVTPLIGTANVYAGVSKAVCSVMMAGSAMEADKCLSGSGWDEDINADYQKRGRKVRR